MKIDLATCTDLDLAQFIVLARNEYDNAKMKLDAVIAELNKRAESAKKEAANDSTGILSE